MAFRRVALNTGLQLLGHVVAIATGFLTLGLLTRYLGVEGYGTFALITLLFALAIAAGASFDILVVRRLAADDDGDGAFVGNVLALRLVLTTTVAVVTTVAAATLPVGFHLRIVVALLGAALVLAAARATIVAQFQARAAFGVPVLLDAAANVATLICLAAVTLSFRGSNDAPGARLALAAAVPTVVGAVALAAAIVVARRRFAFRLRVDLAVWRSVAREALPLTLLAALGLVSYRLDTAIVAIFDGAGDAGIYAVGYRFLEATVPLAAFFLAALFPLLARDARQAAPERRLHAQRAFDLLVLFALPISIAVGIAAPSLVRILAGEPYEPAALPLRIAVISIPFSFAAMLLLQLLLAAKLYARAAYVAAGGATATLVANLALVPAYGYVGAAAATAVVEAAGCLALAILVERWLGIRLRLRASARPAVAAALMLAVALGIAPFNLVAAVVAGGVVYAGVVLIRRPATPALAAPAEA